MRTILKAILPSVVLLLIVAGPSTPVQAQCGTPSASLVASGFGGLFGNVVGPDGAIYIADSDNGNILRFDPGTGDVSTFASGLPHIPFVGGPWDVAFIGHTAYVLVTLVDPFVGGHSIDGIYRIDGPHHFAVIANIGKFAKTHPPRTPFDLPKGVQFAFRPYQGGFIVTDGHHNRVYQVTLDGNVSELISFDDIVPTGLEVVGKTIYMCEAGPVPHRPKDGKIVTFTAGSATATEVAFGARLLVDVESAHGRLYGLSQGLLPDGAAPGTPALPNTGSIVRANADGTFTKIIDHLNDPDSFEIIGNVAYVFTINGEIWKIDDLACP